MVQFQCPKCNEIMSNNKPIEMMGFIDFVITADGKIKINRTWTNPKNKDDKAVKKITKMEPIVKSGSVEM